MITGSIYIDCFMIQVNTLMADVTSSETHWGPTLVAGKDHDNHKYRIQLYQQVQLNTIPTTELRFIITQRTYNQWHYLTHNAQYQEHKPKSRDNSMSMHSAYLHL